MIGDSRPLSSLPLLDLRYWQFVAALVQVESVRRDLKQTAIRHTVIPTLSSFIARVATASDSLDHSLVLLLLQSLLPCYTTLLPVSVNAASVDTLLACFASFFTTTSNPSASSVTSTAEWIDLGKLLLDSVQRLPNDKNVQKKVSFPRFQLSNSGSLRLTRGYVHVCISRCHNSSWTAKCSLTFCPLSLLPSLLPLPTARLVIHSVHSVNFF